MALTRKFLSALGIESDKIDEIISAHAETVDGLKEQLKQFKDSAEKLPDVQRQLDELKATAKNSGDYDKLKKEFDDYKAEVKSRETLAAKKEALKKIAKDANLTEAGIAKAVKYTNFDEIELDDDGNVVDAKALMKSLKEEWSDYVQTTKPQGAKTATPPDENGSHTVKTREEIMKIKDTAERQRAWAEYLNAQKN